MCDGCRSFLGEDEGVYYSREKTVGCFVGPFSLAWYRAPGIPQVAEGLVEDLAGGQDEMGRRWLL